MKILTTAAIEQFGEILDESFFQEGVPVLMDGEFDTMDLHLSEDNDLFLCYHASVVAMYVLDGVSKISFLSDERLSTVSVFLLDRPLLLHEGTHFCIRALVGHCSVRLFFNKDAHHEKLRFMLEDDRAILSDRLYVNNIYTLFYQEKSRDFFFKGEKHSFWELTYVDYGGIDTCVDGRDFTLNQGEAILYSPGQYHTQQAADCAYLNFVTITFDMILPKRCSLDNRVFVVGNDQAHILKGILREYQETLPFYETSIINELKRFLISLIRMDLCGQNLGELTSTAKSYTEIHVVDKAVEYIHSNIGRYIRLEDIAQHVNLSKPYLSLIFKKHKSQTPIEYLINARLARSKELIKEGRLNITEIAEVLGYSSIHYFSNQFKMKFGVNPTDYSRSVGQ